MVVGGGKGKRAHEKRIWSFRITPSKTPRYTIKLMLIDMGKEKSQENKTGSPVCIGGKKKELLFFLSPPPPPPPPPAKFFSEILFTLSECYKNWHAN